MKANHNYIITQKKKMLVFINKSKIHFESKSQLDLISIFMICFFYQYCFSAKDFLNVYSVSRSDSVNISEYTCFKLSSENK